MSKRIQRRKFLGLTAAGLALPPMMRAGLSAASSSPVTEGQPHPGKDVFSPLASTEGGLRGWIGAQIREDANNGWVAICNKLSHQGIKEWDPNHAMAVPYLRPWAMWQDAPTLYGRTTTKPAMHFDSNVEWPHASPDDPFFQAASATAKSVPFYYDIVEPVVSMGSGEFEGHWMDTLFRMAWPGGVKEYQTLAHQCARDILAARDPSGYMGTDLPQNRFTTSYCNQYVAFWIGAFEVGGMASIWEALLTYYRFTGDKAVLEAVTQAADRMMARMQGEGTEVNFTDVLTPPTVKKSPKEMMGIAGGLIDFALLRLYQLTGKKDYLDRATQIWNYEFDVGFAAQVAKGPDVPLEAHAASSGIMMVQAVELYRSTGDTSWLEKAQKMNEKIVRHSTQVTGVPTGHREGLVLAGPGANTETCNLFFYPWFWTEMFSVTGETRYADLAERCVLNALPGTRSKNGAAAPFFARPNQLFALRGYNGGTSYCVRHYIECCKGNYGRALPVLAEHMVMPASEGGLGIGFYSTGEYRVPCGEAGWVKITQQTEYPFAEDVKITVTPENGTATFRLKLRVPGWCKAPRVKINSQEAPIPAVNGWIVIERQWKAEDAVELLLPQEVKVVFDKKGLATVERGPLVYALPVKGQQIPIDTWGSFEQLVTAQDKWNYALLLDKVNPSKSFRVKELEVPAAQGHVWEFPHYGLEVEAVRLAEWKFQKSIAELMKEGRDPANVLEPAPPPGPFRGTGPSEKIVLVPYGFTILRMTHLPAADL